MTYRVAAVALLALSACAREPADCDELAAELSCPANSRGTCTTGEPECECYDGYGWIGDRCVRIDYEACCGCLSQHYYLSGETTTDNSFDRKCIPSASQCVSALEARASITIASRSCATAICAGDCWFMR